MKPFPIAIFLKAGAVLVRFINNLLGSPISMATLSISRIHLRESGKCVSVCVHLCVCVCVCDVCVCGVCV